MDSNVEFGGSPVANTVMRNLAELAVRQNGGEIPPKPEDEKALEDARKRLREAGLPISGAVKIEA